MASIDRHRPLKHRHLPIFRLPSRAKTDPSAPPLQTRTKRRKLPSVRLGGPRRGRRFFLVGLFKRLRIRWLRLQYSCVLKKLKAAYFGLLKDLVETEDSLEEIQKRIMLDSYFNVPVIGLGVASVPSHVERTGRR
ncbi:hypothetical protein ACLOJK_001045 [Asimina triloba]